MTPEEIKQEVIGGATYILTEGSTEKASAAATRMIGDLDGAALTIAEGSFVVAWLASTLLAAAWPTEQKNLIMTALANAALHIHHSMPGQPPVATGPAHEVLN